MSLLLAPYNTAMRLGQGFNSYTQQICIDDAVVVDPDRAENIVTNDGTTMRIMAQLSAKPSAWNRQQEVVSDKEAREVVERLKKPHGRAEGETDGTDERDGSKDAGDGEGKPEDAENGDDPGAEEEDDQDDGAEKKPSSDEKTAPKEEDDSESADDSVVKVPRQAVDPPEQSDDKDADEDGGAKSDGGKGGDEEDEPPEIDPNEERKADPAPAPKRSRSATAHHRPSADTAAEKEERRLLAAEERKRLAEQRKIRDEIDKEKREEERERRVEDREEQRQLRQEKRQWEAERRKEAQQAISEAAKKNAEPLTLEQLAKIKAQNQFVDRFTGMDTGTVKYEYDPTAPAGPSQTVVYSSKFIDRLSDITEDMSISGALSIKASKIGGSGRGSFVDSDKFKESDLKFYISVKVTNQTLNFKDALVYNPMEGIKGAEFGKIYGDSFISGFVEGGEFNALVSMKVLNKAKMTDIQAQAKVALTAGPVNITAEANVGIARSNIETNTETTIQVSWCGGGHIKPMEQPWNIESIMQAAARFPSLVAECPQRTYAILTKFDSLRSFVLQKPLAYTPLQYECAQLYTNALMDTFMSYKSMYKLAGEHIEAVQRKLLEIVSWEPTDDAPVAKARFEASVKGLSDARAAMRKQMTIIVNEVDLIEGNPKIATKTDRKEPFESPASFNRRLPGTKVPAALELKAQPLDGKRIAAKTQTEEEFRQAVQEEEAQNNAESLMAPGNNLSEAEKNKIAEIEKARPGVGSSLRVSNVVGGTTDKATWFNNLDFVQDAWKVTSVQVEVSRGAVVAVEVTYDNGLHLRKGQTQGQESYMIKLEGFRTGERIVSATIESGNVEGNSQDVRITAIRLFTNRGRKLVGQAASNTVKGGNRVEKDGIVFENVIPTHFDVPIELGSLKGFFGWVDTENPKRGLLRLGLVWGSTRREDKPASNASELDYETPPFLDAQSGAVKPSTWSASSAEVSQSTAVVFPTALEQTPRLLVGLGSYHSGKPERIVFNTRSSELSRTGFRATFTGASTVEWAEPKTHWLTIPENDIHFEYGYFDTTDLPHSLLNGGSIDRVTNRQVFSRPFNSEPAMIVWFTDLNVPAQVWHRMAVHAERRQKDSFDLWVNSWMPNVVLNHNTFNNARVGWLAFETSGSKNRIEVGGPLTATKTDPWKKETITLTGFTKRPNLFLVPHKFDFSGTAAIALQADVLEVRLSSFDVQYGSINGASSDIGEIQWSWVAVE